MATMVIDNKGVIVRQSSSPVCAVEASPQIDKVSAFLELHGDGAVGFRPRDISTVPVFIPHTPTEALLLTVMLADKGTVKGVQRTFDTWWNSIALPPGLMKLRQETLRSDAWHLRLVPGIDYVPGVRWVVFDPNTYPGKSPVDALAWSVVDRTTLAHTEVLMAAALFPDWALSWHTGRSFSPNLSALQLYHESGWSNVPRLDSGQGDLSLRLSAVRAYDSSHSCASPTVREC